MTRSLPTDNYREEKRKRELAETGARKAAYEASRDVEVERCVVAYFAHRTAGGQMMWADFRRDWLKENGGLE